MTLRCHGLCSRRSRRSLPSLTFDARIPQLPYHLSLDSVKATSAGIAITASAQNVVLGG